METVKGLPDAAEQYTTAYHAGLAHFCSIVDVDRKNEQYRVNFGFADVWMPASELSRFTI